MISRIRKGFGVAYMDKYKKLENITNALQAAGKIKSVYRSDVRSEAGTSVRQDNVCLLCDALRIITELSPRKNEKNIAEVIDKSSLYSNTYRNLKQHLRSADSRDMNREALVKTLNIIKPFLSGRHTLFVDKLSKIHEILKS